MDWLVFYKELYFHEIERKYSLMRSMALPVGVATVLSSGLMFLAGQITRISTAYDTGLLTLLSCAAILLFMAVYFMKRAYYNHSYHYLPTTLQLESYRLNLENYYKQRLDKPIALQTAERETVQYLTDAFARATHENALVNDARTRFLFWANASLSGALLLLMLGSVATLVSRFWLAA